MSTVVSIEEAQAKLKELIARLSPGDEVLITENDRPVAELRFRATHNTPRQPGACKGMVLSYIDDDEHLKDFEEYM